MSNAALMLPVFAQIALTFVVLAKMGTSRIAAVKAREVKMADIALSGEAWSKNVKKVSNNYTNQLQVPVLFYVAAGFFMLLGKIDIVAIVLSWAFVASRYVHAFIHIRENRVTQRFNAFAVGVVFVLALWVWLALRLYVIG